MLCYAVLCYAMVCYGVLCYAMLCWPSPDLNRLTITSHSTLALVLCHAVLCYAVICCAVLCNEASRAAGGAADVGSVHAAKHARGGSGSLLALLLPSAVESCEAVACADSGGGGGAAAAARAQLLHSIALHSIA